jgi:hypothetical protein
MSWVRGLDSSWCIGHCIVPVLDYDCGAVGGMSGTGNRTSRGKLSPVPLGPPQIPHDRRLIARGHALQTLWHGLADKGSRFDYQEDLFAFIFTLK